MVWRRLTTMRGRLVVWYLGVLAVLLLGLGIFQSITLASYLRTTTFDSLRDTARSELAALGPCFIRSSGDLGQNAQRLAELLGSREVGVKIVTPSGLTLADRGFGAPGNIQDLQLSAATIRTLIGSSNAATIAYARAAPPRSGTPGGCLQPPVPNTPERRPYQYFLRPVGPAVSANDLLLTAVPLGPPGDVVGYAILGRSMVEADATVRQAQVVFGLGALAALLVAALVALPIINRALRPLYRVARTAEAIASGDLEKRANLARSPDEVGRLGSAFDAMVDRLQAALTAATQSEERMRRFLADASHELRTPLTVLRGASQVLLRHDVAQREHESALAAIHFEAVRLSRLVDDLLTLTRLDAGESFEPQPVSVRHFVEDFVDRYGAAWPERVIQINAATWDGAEAYVDPEVLRRILTNLVDNAARYSAPGRPITLTGQLTATTVSLMVCDEGPGLSPGDAERVFERFYRANKSRSRQSGGTGLGLSIVFALVEASGAHIRMDTGPDRGTTVELTLPRPVESALDGDGPAKRDDRREAAQARLPHRARLRRTD